MSFNKHNTYFELCNDILNELFYETVDNFDELENITEGKKVKRDLNHALSYICNNETVNWKFRQRSKNISLVPKMEKYDMPNGYLRYLRYDDVPIVLSYNEQHEVLPKDTEGMPLEYWVEENKINLYPAPSQYELGRLINVDYNTYDFAKDCCGVDKPLMEYEKDSPIIPCHHSDILKWKVCADWRGSINDSKAAYYEKKFKRAYQALLDDQRQSADYPNGLYMNLNPVTPYSSIIKAFYNPYTTRII